MHEQLKLEAIETEISHENDVFSNFRKFEDNTKRQSTKEDVINFKKIEGKVLMVEKQISPKKNIYEKMDDYEETTHDREFFYTNQNGSSYLQMLFGLPEHIINTKEGRELIAEKINNKTIILLGGSDSIKDLLTSEFFHPKEVINIDPYMKSETVSKNVHKNYHSVTESAADVHIIDEIISGELPKADEIWATVSVPFYLTESEDIKNLFTNISVMLDNGGTARIYPIALQYNATDKDSYESRKRAFLKAIDILMMKKDLNIKLIENINDAFTLVIQKVKLAI